MRLSVPLALLAACAQPSVEVDDGVDTSGVDDTVDGSADPIPAYDPLPLVDPFAATGGDGAEIAGLNPGAIVPVGMVHLGPDTRRNGAEPSFYHFGGYWWNDTHVRDFSHTHSHGMGTNDYGTVAFLPRDGWDPSYTEAQERMVAFSHDEEEASPGYYRVVLGGGESVVELTASLRGGHTRMTYPEGASPVLVFDLGRAPPNVEVTEAWATWTPGARELEGFQRASGGYSKRFGGLMTHFAATLDPAPVGGGTWTDRAAPVAAVGTGEQHVEGATSGVWLEFPEGTTVVELRLAISYVDTAGAWKNHEAELDGVDFDTQRARAEAAWRERMEVVRVRGGSDEEQRVFHTALYNSLKFPSRQDDVDGRYRGVDQALHTADGPHYSDLSMWDTFRTTHPWYTLAWPDLQLDVDRSLVRMVRDGGSLPKWPLAHGYTGGMVGSPAIQILAESWLKGIRDFDVDTAYAASLAVATGPVPQAGRGGLSDYQTLGWVALEDGGGSVSDTLEYAWNDHALALWGDALGKPEAEVERVRGQSRSWRNLWNADAGFFTARRRDGTFDWDGKDLGWSPAYVEGNAWHYLWYVPYDVGAMIDVQHGGDREAFFERYAAYWEQVYNELDDKVPDDYYWHGNEPVMHVAFLGSLAGRPDLTAEAARWVLAHRYSTAPNGLDGNDDAGTLSAWYLWASIGLFPIAGTTTYALASPLWERVEISPPGRQGLVIRAPGASPTVRYPVRWSVGDVAVPASTVDHATLSGGGDVVIELSADPGVWSP